MTGDTETLLERGDEKIQGTATCRLREGPEQTSQLPEEPALSCLGLG